MHCPYCGVPLLSLTQVPGRLSSLRSMPTVAQIIQEVVSEKLGRPAILRTVKNGDNSYILDPVFYYIQTADRNRRRDYRQGFLWAPKHRCLWFHFVHNPIAAETFKQNLDVFQLFEIIRITARFRSIHNLYFSSRSEFSTDHREMKYFYNEDLKSFLKALKEFDDSIGLKADLFPRLPNRGKNRTTEFAWSSGNHLSLLLATGGAVSFDKPTIKKIIDRAWPLFMNLYPSEPIFKRDATLARQLLVKDKLKQCNCHSIERLPKKIKTTACDGPIDAAHIKPHRLGGSDKAENGIWLCRVHHKLTEGKLKGNWPRPAYMK